MAQSKNVEVQGEQKQIDETAWIQRAAYVNPGTLLDSLRKENEALEKRDEIVSLTTITGKLNLKVDSLETNRREIDLSFMFALRSWTFRIRKKPSFLPGHSEMD